MTLNKPPKIAVAAFWCETGTKVPGKRKNAALGGFCADAGASSKPLTQK